MGRVRRGERRAEGAAVRVIIEDTVELDGGEYDIRAIADVSKAEPETGHGVSVDLRVFRGLGAAEVDVTGLLDERTLARLRERAWQEADDKAEADTEPMDDDRDPRDRDPREDDR